MSDLIPVVIQGQKTSLVLNERGPLCTAADLERFQARLRFRLPPTYCEFLLKYNGGSPESSVVKGLSDDEDVPYMHGNFVNWFFCLPSPDVESYESLQTPAELGWFDRDDFLAIGQDGFGNLFVLCLWESNPSIRFVDHEEELPLEEYRVMGSDFLDLLMRFTPVEEQRQQDLDESEKEQRRFAYGAFRFELQALIGLLTRRWPDLGPAIRQAFLSIFEAKGYVALHSDDLSLEVFDLMFVVTQLGTGYAIDCAEFQAKIESLWFRDGEDEFGLTGYAPDFVKDWWRARSSRSAFSFHNSKAKATTEMIAAVRSRWGF